MSFQLDLRFSFRAQKEAIRSSYAVQSESLALAIQRDSEVWPYLEIRRNGKEVALSAKAPPPNTRPLFPDTFLKELFAKDKLLLRDDDLLLWTSLRGLPPFALPVTANCMKSPKPPSCLSDGT